MNFDKYFCFHCVENVINAKYLPDTPETCYMRYEWVWENENFNLLFNCRREVLKYIISLFNWTGFAPALVSGHTDGGQRRGWIFPGDSWCSEARQELPGSGRPGAPAVPALADEHRQPEEQVQAQGQHPDGRQHGPGHRHPADRQPGARGAEIRECEAEVGTESHSWHLLSHTNQLLTTSSSLHMNKLTQL